MVVVLAPGITGFSTRGHQQRHAVCSELEEHLPCRIDAHSLSGRHHQVPDASQMKNRIRKRPLLNFLRCILPGSKAMNFDRVQSGLSAKRT